MRRLRPAPNLAIATVWTDLLHEAGIAASVQRAFAAGSTGLIPPDQALPEVWVAHEEQYDRALALLAEAQHGADQHWACPGCGEQIDGPFEQCWNCGHAMPPGP